MPIRRVAKPKVPAELMSHRLEENFSILQRATGLNERELMREVNNRCRIATRSFGSSLNGITPHEMQIELVSGFADFLMRITPQKLSEFATPDDFWRFFHRSLHNKGIDILRKHGRIKAESIDDPASRAFLTRLEVYDKLDVRDEIRLTQLHEVLNRAIGELPPGQRSVVEQRFFHGANGYLKPIDEIAKKNGTTKGTVKQHLHRGLMNMRNGQYARELRGFL